MDMQELSSASLALTGQFPPSAYTKFEDIVEAVTITKEELKTHDMNQYLSFKPISPEDYEEIVNKRSQLGHVRLTYYPDIETLIVKVLTFEHETAHRQVGRKVESQLEAMNVDIDQFLSIGATLYESPTASKKEADSSWRNPTLRPNRTDWPNLVIESGVSESLPRLRQEAAWWIGNSRGRVRIVLIIKVTRDTKCMVIEKYVPSIQAFPYPNTRAAAQALAPVPRLDSTTVVNQGANPPNVQGPPVVLEFQRLIGRPAVPPEADIRLGPALLLLIAQQDFPP